MDNQLGEPFNINTFINYIKENIIGLLLLIFAVFIIYLVDNINNINAFIITTLNITGAPIPSIPNITFDYKKTHKKNKKK